MLNRRVFFTSCLLGFLGLSPSLPQRGANLIETVKTGAAMGFWNIGDVYLLEDGDGDPTFMHVQHVIEVVEEDWFNGTARGEPAQLFQISGPYHVGRFVALVPRTAMALDEQMITRGFASVIVNLVENATDTYGVSPMDDCFAIGMTVLQRLDDRKI